jgi:hypothetical protein
LQVTKGYLLISDITGYTEFLVGSELDHATEILQALLQVTIDAVRAPIRMLNTRGDAVFAFVAADRFLQPQSLLESIEQIYLEFHRRLQLMDLNTTCTCKACANMAALDLKLFLHYGQYAEQELDGAVELQGADVILASLLMKNGVKEATGLAGYALITEAAVEAMEAGEMTTALGMHHHTETYEHFGEVPLRIWDLPAAWQREQAERPEPMAEEDAWVVESIDTPAPPWVAWDYATDADRKRIYYDMLSVTRTDDDPGPVGVGSQYHCVHELGEVTFTITDWDPPRYFASDELAFGIPVRFTMKLLPHGEGTRIQILYGEPEGADTDELEPLFREAAREALARLADLLPRPTGS